ncbi:MAG: AAA family ATPase [Proteobacteria bacterium]|nr:AAA family ATPase [Pseudomonadota bacterium]
MVQRSLNLSTSNSFFLFGPRGTGKTTLILEQFSDKNTNLYLDLLDIELMDQLLLNPLRFREIIDSPEHKAKRVIIDEVQKFPKILDIVHSQIRDRKRQFILTGSSSRKLMQQGSNLLAGRAWVYHLYPLSILELNQDFPVRHLLEF